MNIKKNPELKKVNPKQIKESEKRLNVFNKYIHWIFLFGILILTGIIYSDVINFDFVNIDDQAKIIENSYVRNFSFEGFKQIFSSYVFHSYLPVTTFSYAFEYNMWGLNPHYIHFVNLLIHLVNVVLLFFFLKILTQRKEVIFVATALFALHPMNVETVSWLSERSNLLYGMFFIASMYFYVLYINKNKIYFLIISFVLCVLSMMSKSSAVPLSLSIILIDYLKGRKFSGKLILEKIPFLITSLVFGVIAIHAMSSTSGFRNLENVYSYFDRIFLVTYPLAFYIIKFIFPFNLNLFNSFPDNHNSFLPIEFYLSLLFLIAIVVLIYKSKKVKKEFIFGALFFLCNLSVLINIIPIGGNFITAEHFAYIPYIGLAMITGFVYRNINDKIIVFPAKIKILTPLIFGIIILFFTYQSSSRVKVWQNSETLFTDAVKNNPENATCYYGLGSALQSKKQLPEALKNYDKAISIKPNYTEAFYNRANVNMQLEKKEFAIQDFNQAVKFDSLHFLAFNYRGFTKKKMGDTVGAINDFSKSIKINPLFSLAYYNRGSLYSNSRKYQLALEDLTYAIKLNPKYAEAYINRGIVKFFLKDYLNSISDYTKAIKLQPRFAMAYKNRGLSKLALKDTVAACSDFGIAVDLGFKPATASYEKYCECKHDHDHDPNHHHH